MYDSNASGMAITVISKIWQILKNRIVQTVLLLILYSIMAPYLSERFQSFLYSLSLSIKEILLWLLPLTVAFFLAYTIKSFRRRAPLFVVVILVFEFVSNFSSVWYSYLCAQHFSGTFMFPGARLVSNDLAALWSFPFARPAWWAASKGSIVGFAVGCVLAIWPRQSLVSLVDRGKVIMESILTKLFSPLIPIFVIGFAAKLYCSGVFTEVLENYGFVIICMCVVLAMYILLLVALGAGTNFAYIMQNLRNIFPAAAVAFTSGCSLSTMPWTIAGVRKNLHNPALAEAVIPATTNIQQIGDCIANTFICFFLYKGIFGHPPDLLLWLEFSVVFTLMRFATAAVLGGAIFLMLPLYQRYFGFGDEVLAVIVALNVFIDPIITFTNVLANAALCRVFERVWLSINDLMMRLKRQA